MLQHLGKRTDRSQSDGIVLTDEVAGLMNVSLLKHSDAKTSDWQLKIASASVRLLDPADRHLSFLSRDSSRGNAVSLLPATLSSETCAGMDKTSRSGSTLSDRSTICASGRLFNPVHHTWRPDTKRCACTLHARVPYTNEICRHSACFRALLNLGRAAAQLRAVPCHSTWIRIDDTLEQLARCHAGHLRINIMHRLASVHVIVGAHHWVRYASRDLAGRYAGSQTLKQLQYCGPAGLVVL